MAEQPRGTPRTYFLNEQHELSPLEKEGFGQPKKYVKIDWTQKGQRLRKALVAARDSIAASPDPLKENRFFIVVEPEPKLRQPSTSKKFPKGEREREVSFSGEDSDVFRRLGMDLLSVSSAGEALVHATVECFDQLTATSERLDSEGVREKARWAPLASVAPVPSRLRVSQQWLGSLSARSAVKGIIELQPVLQMVEAEQVARALLNGARELAGSDAFGIEAAGTDFSGRRWYRASGLPRVFQWLAESFQSIQRIHEPHWTPLAAPGRGGQPLRSAQGVVVDARPLPTVAILDAGVPSRHPRLAAYRRSSYTQPDGPVEAVGSHASRVASRVVFGEVLEDGTSVAKCGYFDANIVDSSRTLYGGQPKLDDQVLVTALETIASTTPDVRVFNLSLGTALALGHAGEDEVDRQERLTKLRNLDNFAFIRDALIVVGAGNSAPGVRPASAPYPDHVDEPLWKLGHWACGFNSVTVGSFVGAASADGLAGTRGAPSPFTRIGPGYIASAPVPDLSAPGGDCGHDYAFHAGLGVGCLNDEGLWEDGCGTSYAAPLVSQAAALAIEHLAVACPPGVRPAAGLARAVLALTASRPALPPRFAKLADRTLGRGFPDVAALLSPDRQRALLIWQGTVPDMKQKVRVRIPVPNGWVKKAGEPCLRLVVGWLTPTNEAFLERWACRKIEATLRTKSRKAVHVASRSSSDAYPLFERLYELKTLGADLEDDELVLEIGCLRLHEEPLGRPFPMETKVGVAVELLDHSDLSESPHGHLQSCVLIQAATRLSLAVPGIAVPIRGM